MAGGKNKQVEDKKKKTVDHPTTSEMVLNAVRTLKDRNGSSLQAIKKYIGENYKFDPTKQATLVNKTIKNLVEKGSLSQVKGSGANGSFKIGTTPKPPKEQASKEKSSPKKKTETKSAKKSVKKEMTKTKSAPKKSVKVTPPRAKTVKSSAEVLKGRTAPKRSQK